MSVEWDNRGTRVNGSARRPRPTEGMRARLNPGTEHKAPEVHGNPMGRVGEMPELANLAVQLMARGSEYINGQTIAIDGAAFQANGGNFSRLAGWGDAEWKHAREAIEQRNAQDRAQRSV